MQGPRVSTLGEYQAWTCLSSGWWCAAYGGVITAARMGGREGGSPAPPLGRQPGSGSRQMRSYPSTASGSPLRELILIRCTAACPRVALAVLSFSSDLQHLSGMKATANTLRAVVA